jgi:hypothetical protein
MRSRFGARGGRTPRLDARAAAPFRRTGRPGTPGGARVRPCSGFHGPGAGQRSGVATRERLEGFREGKLELPSLEEAAPEQTAGRLIPSGEASLSRPRRLQVPRRYLQIGGELPQTEARLFQEVYQVKPTHVWIPSPKETTPGAQPGVTMPTSRGRGYVRSVVSRFFESTRTVRSGSRGFRLSITSYPSSQRWHQISSTPGRRTMISIQVGQLTSAFSHGQSMIVLPGRTVPRRLGRTRSVALLPTPVSLAATSAFVECFLWVGSSVEHPAGPGPRVHRRRRGLRLDPPFGMG